MTKPYPKEFRDDVVRVALNREPGVELAQIAKDFGVHFTTLYGWMKKAEVEAGDRSGTTGEQPPNSRPRSGGLGPWSRKLRSCAGQRHISPKLICRENELPARPSPSR
jgi:transposase-like protein